ncbi:MAG: alpha/beta hydrolase [Burkholderiaceae bacterium]
MRDAPVPIVARTVATQCASPVDTLIVLLPGAYDHAEDFVAEGFVAALQSRHIAADIALVDATIPYYRERIIVTRLETDVIAPARARGIRHIWLAGISLGGLGSLIYANERHGVVDGLLLIAPYLGERSVTAEVTASGGLARWAPPGRIPDDDGDRRIWQWLKTLTMTPPTEAGLPVVYLGFGVDDRFATSHRLLAATLPPDHVFTAPGTHDWPAWRPLWSAMLDAAPLPRDPSCGQGR